MDAKIFLYLDEAVASMRPRDSAGNLNDLKGQTNAPTVVDGITGKARSFGGAAGAHGLIGTDVVSGSTLLNRDVTVQAILTFDQSLASGANPGSIIARGKGSSAAEYHPYALEVRLVNATSQIAELRWLWQDAAGTLKTQIGGHFQTSTDWIILTATRRWVSSTEVVLRYYLADELLAEVPSIDGSIGGGTTGETAVGTRFTGGVYSRWYSGKIDQLRVLDRELQLEEIRATWRRLTVDQPRAYQLVREMHDPGFPMSKDPSSRVQRETRMWGDGLGYASAQAENVRENILPTRAYARTLEAWEDITKQAPKPGDSTERRRNRVVGRMRQRAGVSVPGIKTALEELVGTDPENLEIIGFSQTVSDSFASLDVLRWLTDPIAQWTLSGSAMRCQAAAGTYTYEAGSWYTALESIGADGRAAHNLAKLTIATLPANGQAGIVFADLGRNNALFLGVRNLAGTYQVVTEAYRSGASQGLVVQASLGGSPPAAIWLHLWHVPDALGTHGPTNQNMFAAWSTTSALTGYTTSAAIPHPWRAQWAGHYARTLGAIGSALDVKFDDSQIRSPYSDRAFLLYVYRNPGLAGSFDKIGANLILRGLKQAHTVGAVVDSKIFLCDSAASLCDETPLGGY